MKYCAKCGNELMDEAVICTKCGCAVQQISTTAPAEKNKLISVSSDKNSVCSWIPLVFGILALVDAVLFVLNYVAYLWYFDVAGISVYPLLGIITSIKYFKGENRTYSILGLIFSCVSVVIKLIMVILYFYVL